MEKKLGYALITGASQGLGKALAFELAQRKQNLLLVALPGEGLPELAAKLIGLQVRVHVFETDLSIKENVEVLAKAVNSQFAVNILINNAGRGGTKQLKDASTDYLNNILQLNVVATVLLTRLLLDNLKQHQHSYLLNVSSMAAFSPIAHKTVYPASKAFIRHWSLGLCEELKQSSISVSVVYPGPMKTNPDATQRIENQGFKGKIGLLSPEAVARIAIDGMFQRKSTIVPGFANQLNYWLMAILPLRLVIPLISRTIKKELPNP